MVLGLPPLLSGSANLAGLRVARSKLSIGGPRDAESVLSKLPQS